MLEQIKTTPGIAPNLQPTPIAPDALENRNTFLEDTFNAAWGQPLPQVTLREETGERHAILVDGQSPERTEHPGTLVSRYAIISPSEEQVGFAVVNHPTSEYLGSKQHAFIGDIQVTDRDKGYGPATYLAILQSLPAHEGLRTEGVLSDAARDVWEKMVAMGIAKSSDQSGTVTGFETTYSVG